MVTTVIKMEIDMPIMGARKIKSMISVIFLSSIMLPKGVIPFVINACEMAAPANPPINVWEEEEGMPYHQVNRFQNMAAINKKGNKVEKCCPYNRLKRCKYFSGNNGGY
jgi:hypothetical protein